MDAVPANGSNARWPLLTPAMLAIMIARDGSKDVGPKYNLFFRSERFKFIRGAVCRQNNARYKDMN